MNLVLYLLAGVGLFLLGKNSAQNAQASTTVKQLAPAPAPHATGDVAAPPGWQQPAPSPQPAQDGSVPTDNSPTNAAPAPVTLPDPNSPAETSLFAPLPSDVRGPIVNAYRTSDPDTLYKLSVAVQEDFPAIASVLATKAAALKAAISPAATGRRRQGRG